MSEAGSKLGGLPTLGYGPVTLDQAPVVQNPNAGRIFGQIADTAESIGKMFQPELNERAANQGAMAVTRDDQGNLVAAPHRTVLTQADAAYENAAHLKYMSEATLDAQTQLGQLRAQHANDPQGFQAGLDGLVTGATQNAPPQFQGPLTQMILQQGGAIHEDLINSQLQNSAQTAAASSNKLYDANTNTILDYAYRNQMADPRAQALLQQNIDLIRAQMGNPVFHMDQQQADLKIAELQHAVAAQGITGHAIATYTQNPDLSPAEVIAKAMDDLHDPALGLSPPEISSYEGRVRQAVNEIHAAAWQDQTELRQQAEYRLDDAETAALTTGDYSKVITRQEITAAYAKNPQRAAQIIGRLDAATEIYSMRKNVAMARPSQLAEMDHDLNPATNGAGTTPTGFNSVWSQFTAPHEGGYTPSDSNGAPANFGINQSANPDVDVKNLTGAQAAQIAKDRYWTPSGADALPANMAAVQFDTAFNMGVPEAKQLLAQSGGDVNKYLALREQHYRDIVANDPSKAAQLPNWLQRNADLKNFVNGGDIADQARVYGAFQQAVQQRNEAIVKDPAAYVLNARPDVSQQLASQDPATVQQGVRSMMAIQRDIGVINPRIMDKQTQQAILAAFNNPSDPTKTADGMNSVIDGLAQRYGNYFPQVMTDLQKAGMPPEASSLYMVRGDGTTAVRMATAINSMAHIGKDLNAGRDAFFSNAPNNSEIRRAMPGVMSDYADTLRGSPDGPQQTQTMTNAVNLYARQLAYEGLDPNQAVQKAHDDLIGSKYNFVDNYRVPRGIDQSLIQAGANYFKANIPVAEVEPYGEPAPGVSEEQRRALSMQILRSRGVWVTRADDKGLSLMWPQDTGFKPVRDIKGNSVNHSWAELQRAGQGAPPVAAPTFLGIPAGVMGN